MTIKLLLLDCDGVLTDGTKTYDRWGNCISKNFCDRDWTAIKRFKALGVQVVLISGDNWNEHIAWNRNLDIILTRDTGKDKSEFLPEICEKYNVKPEEICFVGDDIFDVKLMKLVGYAVCPLDCPDEVRACSTSILFAGGNSFVSHLFDWLKCQKMIPPIGHFDEHLNKVYELDKKEKF